MTVNIGEASIFSELKFRINTTVYTTAGDSITRKLNKVGLNPDSYARRHYVINGGFKSYFPNTTINEQIGNVGSVWPFDENIETDTFQITALQDNSAYICIIPTDPNYKIIHRVDKLVAGQPYMTTTGLCYISTVDYALHTGEQKLAHSILLCATQPVVIIPAISGNLLVFASQYYNDSTNILV